MRPPRARKCSGEPARPRAQVMPVLFAVLRSADDALREFLVQQLTALVALLRAHMRKWLPDTLALAADFWGPASPQPALLPHLLKLISELAGAVRRPGWAARREVKLTVCTITLMRQMWRSQAALRFHPSLVPLLGALSLDLSWLMQPSGQWNGQGMSPVLRIPDFATWAWTIECTVSTVE